MVAAVDCPLCVTDGGELIWQQPQLRVILANEAGYPGWCRVIWQTHVAEMTDLLPQERALLMQTVCRVEQVMRQVMAPDKVNLAAFGNMVPHLHWHIIPRFADDPHFPQPAWGVPQRKMAAETFATRAAQLPALRMALRAALSAPLPSPTNLT